MITKTSKKVLLVEDDKLTQLVLKEFLTKAGYSFDLAENGKEALHLTEQISYQLILMDIGLPDISGDKVASKIRQSNGASKHVPIVALTAHGGDELKMRCQQAGMNKFVNKPISQKDLRKLLHNVTQPEYCKGNQKSAQKYPSIT